LAKFGRDIVIMMYEASPTLAESPFAKKWGVHCNVGRG
jgi:hypothetical protein